MHRAAGLSMAGLHAKRYASAVIFKHDTRDESLDNSKAICCAPWYHLRVARRNAPPPMARRN